jgi:hypothetical protein
MPIVRPLRVFAKAAGKRAVRRLIMLCRGIRLGEKQRREDYAYG